MALGSLLARRRVPAFLNLSPFDGLLFARTATSIADGDWLGPFTNTTLAKGPGYPLFMAVVHRVGLELKVAEQLVWLAAAGVVALVVVLVTRRAWWGTAVFTVLALDPAHLSRASSDIVRDDLFSSLALLGLGSATLVVIAVCRRSPYLLIAAGGLATGVVSALYWVTREEGATAIPPLAVLVGATLLLSWWLTRGARRTRPWRPTAVRAVAALLATAIGLLLPLHALRDQNERAYGVALTNDMSEGTFLRAYADWSRVRSGESRTRVPITEEQRQAVYAVSPAAAELRGDLERTDNPWRFYDCSSGCEYGGGWMVWALRDAAAAAGHFASAEQDQTYFARLSTEIQQACSDGRLSCAPALPASVQPVQRAPMRSYLRHLVSLSWDLTLSRDLFVLPSREAQPPMAPETRAEYTAIIDGLPIDAQAAEVQMDRFDDRRWEYDVLGWTYRVLVPVLVLAGAVGTVVGLCRVVRRQPVSPAAVALALALGLGVLVRQGLLALVDTAEYEVGYGRYQLPGHVLLLAFGLVGLVCAVGPRAADGGLVAGTGADAGEADGEGHDRQLRAPDDQHHPEDRQPHGLHRVQLTEPAGPPGRERRREGEHPEQD